MLSGELHPLFDPVFLESVVEITPWWIALILVFLTHLGSVFIVVPATVLAYLRYPERAGTWLGSLFCYFGLMTSIKSLNSASRPSVDPSVGPEHVPEVLSFWYSHGAEISTTSFPSGNVMLPTILMALLVRDLRVSTFRRRAIAGASVVALIAYSRMALGVHYPVDVIGGVVFGLGLVAVVVGLRHRFEDELTAVFTLAIGICLFSVWVRNGVWAVPTVASLESSNRPLALGGALGGLVAWQLVNRYRLHGGTYSLDNALGAIGVVGGFGGMYAVHSIVSHPLVSALWATVIFGVVIATPWLFPNRITVFESTRAPAK